jgi:hypothetical protein
MLRIGVEQLLPMRLHASTTEFVERGETTFLARSLERAQRSREERDETKRVSRYLRPGSVSTTTSLGGWRRRKGTDHVAIVEVNGGGRPLASDAPKHVDRWSVLN